MIPYNSSPVLLNISHNHSSSTCNSKRNSLNYNPIVIKPKSNSLSFSKDSEWLTLEICREYLRGECLRDEFSCRYAHPPKTLETQNGRVVCCFDYLKGKCHRHKPPCKYLHPPLHLKDQLLQKGKSNLILKNLQLSLLTNSQTVNITRPQSALPYNMNPMSVTPASLSQSNNIKNSVQIPVGNMQTISYVPQVPCVIIPSRDNHNLSNIQYTHMAIEATQIDSSQNLSLQKSNLINPMKSCGGMSAIVAAVSQTNSVMSPYNHSTQQFSIRRNYCFPYQPVLLRNWPLYTYTTVPY